jgi:curved DNA-binding protein CbpA
MTKDHPGVSIDNAYSVLGVRHDAADADVASAYRALARVYHPDIAGDSGNARMSSINAAWDRVRTPRKRDAYDRELGIYPVHRAPQRREHVRQASRATSHTATAQPAPAAHGSRRRRDGTGAAGPPPGRPSGSVLQFGRHLGWSIGEVARVDPGYLEWLEAHREGSLYLDEIDEALVKAGFRSSRRRPTRQPHQTKRRFRRG